MTTNHTKGKIYEIQANLGRGFKANQSLSNFQNDEQFDMSVIQETYVLTHKLDFQ